MIPHDRIGSIDQVALITQRPAIDIRVYGGIELRLYPDRGLDNGTYAFLHDDLQEERGDSEAVYRAMIHEPRGLRVERTIRTRIGEGRVELVDRTLNVAEEELPAPLLFHVNLAGRSGTTVRESRQTPTRSCPATRTPHLTTGARHRDRRRSANEFGSTSARRGRPW